MFSYSIAIRTLGTAGEKFRRELISIQKQTLQPERVIIYIAEGYQRPDFTIGKEEYISVRKGMVAQRVLSYKEICSDVIFMLDDDVELAPDSAEKLLKAMELSGADCVGADVFRNHEMSCGRKIYAMITNWVYPHLNDKWAFKIHKTGSYSYNNCPRKDFYWSQSAAGPAAIWKKDVFLRLRMADELWLDEMGFPYGEDAVMFYKCHINKYKLGVLYNSGCIHLDGETSSGLFRQGKDRIYIRTKALFVAWWRMIYQTSGTSIGKGYSALCFALKECWLFFIIGFFSLCRFSPTLILQYIRGIKDGWTFVHSDQFTTLRNYDLQQS